MTLARALCLNAVALLLSTSPALAMSWDLPAGLFERVAAPGELERLEVLPHKALRLTFAPGEKEARAIVSTHYKMTAQKFSDFHVTARISAIALGKRKLARVRRMGLDLTPKQDLQLTLHYACVSGHEQVQFCLHAELAGKPHVVCHELVDARSRCTPMPARPPGQLINPPPNQGVVNEDKRLED